MSAQSVLVVDDEESFLTLARRWLADEYDVTTASSGTAALDHVTPETDVVLLDRRMPGMTGEEFLAELEGLDADPLVVLVTGVEPSLDVVDLAFDDYVVKPVTKHEVVDAVEQMLARSTYSDAVRRYFALASKVAAVRNDERVRESTAFDPLSLEARLDDATADADDAVAALFDGERPGSAYDELGDEDA